jgi:hypothetical protein
MTEYFRLDSMGLPDSEPHLMSVMLEPPPGKSRLAALLELCLPITPSECIDGEGRRAMGLM